MPSLKPRKVMSPPSLATAGRTRASISSLMTATVSESFSSKNSSRSADAAASVPFTIGAPDMKCSMMAPRIVGLSCCHSPAFLVTAMKSEPKKTPDTPAIPKRRSARGDRAADSLSRISSVPLASTARPGRNFSVAGFGVGSVWMNMACSFQSQDENGSSWHCNRWRLPAEVQPVLSRQEGRAMRGKPSSISFASGATNGPKRSAPSRHRVEFFIAEMPGDDGDRNGKVARILGDTGNQRPRPLFARRGGKYQNRHVFVVLDEIEDLLRLLAFADHALRHHAGDTGGPGRMAVKYGIGLLVRFRTHDVGDAEPLLIAVVRLNHAQHEHGCPDPQRAPAGKIERSVAFRRIVDDDHEFRRVTSLVAAALLDHRLPRPHPDDILSGGPALCASKCRVVTGEVVTSKILPRSSGAAQGHHDKGLASGQILLRDPWRTKPPMSLTAFMVSAAMLPARSAPSARTESI